MVFPHMFYAFFEVLHFLIWLDMNTNKSKQIFVTGRYSSNYIFKGLYEVILDTKSGLS